MMNKQCWLFGAVPAMGLGLLPANDAVAKGGYLGAEVGQERVLYQPEYSFVSGAANLSFDNTAGGWGSWVLAGYRWQTGEDLAIVLQGCLSAGNAVWTIDQPEPASFCYAIPVNAALSLLPTLRLSPRVALFAEAGIALGKIEERKSATATSRYDVEV